MIYRKTAVRRLRGIFLAVAVTICIGTNHRSTNFTVDAADPDTAVRIAEAAERLRHDLAIEWLGAALPDWPQACAITAQIDSRLAPGGATTSVYDNGKAFVWRMTIRGPAE